MPLKRWALHQPGAVSRVIGFPMMRTVTALPVSPGPADADHPKSKSIVMTNNMIVAMSEAEYETRVRGELMAYVAAKLGSNHPITLACNAACPLEDLWRLALAMYGRTRLSASHLLV
jgi:hypothetical protein